MPRLLQIWGRAARKLWLKLMKVEPVRRPFKPSDDVFILTACEDGMPYRQIAAHLRRTTASVAGRHANLLAEQERRAGHQKTWVGTY